MPQIKMAYCNPELLRAVVEKGSRVVEREPEHPKRPAREYDLNTWWETITEEDANDAVWNGHIVRF